MREFYKRTNDGRFALHRPLKDGGDEPVLETLYEPELDEKGEQVMFDNGFALVAKTKEAGTRPVTAGRVAVAYEASTKALLTHGESETMEEWLVAHNEIAARELAAALEVAGDDEELKAKVADRRAALFVFSESTEVEDINRALSDPKELARLVK